MENEVLNTFSFNIFFLKKATFSQKIAKKIFEGHDPFTRRGKTFLSQIRCQIADCFQKQ